MGFFEDAGRRFEQFKQEALNHAGEDPEYECGACGARSQTASEYCPECGADDIVPIDSPEETSSKENQADDTYEST